MVKESDTECHSINVTKSLYITFIMINQIRDLRSLEKIHFNILVTLSAAVI